MSHSSGTVFEVQSRLVGPYPFHRIVKELGQPRLAISSGLPSASRSADERPAIPSPVGYVPATRKVPSLPLARIETLPLVSGVIPLTAMSRSPSRSKSPLEATPENPLNSPS